MRMKSASRILGVAAPLVLAGVVLGQPGKVQPGKVQPGEQKQPPAKSRAEAQDALKAWFDADPRDRDEQARDKVVSRIMVAGPAGLDLLAGWVRRFAETPDPKLRKPAETLVGQVALRWLKMVEESPSRYAGQYQDLARLEPMAGEFYLRLLLDTPQWFSHKRRWLVISPLRDLFPKGPDPETLAQIEIMANNSEVEPEYLRVGLAYALAQWGRRDLIKVKIRALEKQASSGEPELVLLARRDLAKIYYGIRDYAVGAVAYRDFLQAAEAAETVYPVNYYNAACCMCLSGDRRSAMLFLEKCLAINNSARIDSSMRVKRELFEQDPEIKLLIKDPRFAAMLEQAFGERKSSDGASGKDKARR